MDRWTAEMLVGIKLIIVKEAGRQAGHPLLGLCLCYCVSIRKGKKASLSLFLPLSTPLIPIFNLIRELLL